MQQGTLLGSISNFCQRTCTRPAIVCTPAHDNSISSRLASFNFDSPIR